MRGTQSLLHICVACWKRPSLLGWELLWRWGFGIPAAALLYRQAAGMGAEVAPGLSGLSLSDPVQAGQQMALAAAALKPHMEQVAAWLGPLLLVAWAVASTRHCIPPLSP